LGRKNGQHGKNWSNWTTGHSGHARGDGINWERGKNGSDRCVWEERGHRGDRETRRGRNQRLHGKYRDSWTDGSDGENWIQRDNGSNREDRRERSYRDDRDQR
jgi:hypothetical protein